MNKDHEGQTLKLGDVNPRLTLHISNKYKNSSLGMPSYMAIKKALYVRQPGCFYFWFSLCPLAVTRDLVFSLASEIFNKVPIVTHFGLKKVVILHAEISFQRKSVHSLIFSSYSVTPNELIFLLWLKFSSSVCLNFFRIFWRV